MVGRAKLGGVPMGVIAVETRSLELQTRSVERKRTMTPITFFEKHLSIVHYRPLYGVDAVLV